jgi:hypothetical protein
MRKEYSWLMAVNDKVNNKFKGFVSTPITVEGKDIYWKDKEILLKKSKLYGIPFGKMFKG